MRYAAFRLSVIATWLLLDALASHFLASVAVSFVWLEIDAAYQTPLGRLAWLALFLWMARGSIPSAMKMANRHTLNGDWIATEYNNWGAVQPGEPWQASAWVASRECVCIVQIQWGNGGGGYLQDGPGSPEVYNTHRGGVNLNGFRRVWTASTAARFVRMVLRKGGWIGGPNNPNNDLAWGMSLRPMLARASADQTDASPYVPRGCGAGLQSASTRIEETRQVAAAAGIAAAQVKSVLAVDVNGQSPRLLDKLARNYQSAIELAAAVAFWL